MPKTRTRAVPELWVVFDTNAIYTGSANFLVRKEVADIISDNAAHSDLKIRWFLPAIVRHERQYQMLRQALSFLPTVERLERLIGINLNIAPDILELRVHEAVERHSALLGLEIEELETNATNWPQLILDAAYRRPPFEGGDKEKGFRDAIVLETFVQLVGRAPQSAKSCRLALVSGDKLLQDAAQRRTLHATNVRLFESVDELHGLINTLVSEVDEEFVKELLPQAQRMFFVVKDKGTLYYTGDVWPLTSARLNADIGSLPLGAERHRVAGITVGPPRFVSKERQVIHWSSRIEVRLDALKVAPAAEGSSIVWKNPLLDAGSKLGDLWQKKDYEVYTADLWKAALPDPSSFIDPNTVLFSNSSQVVATGQAAYDVYWKATVSTARKLTHPAIERIQFVEIAWA